MQVGNVLLGARCKYRT